MAHNNLNASSNAFPIISLDFALADCLCIVMNQLYKERKRNKLRTVLRDT